MSSIIKYNLILCFTVPTVVLIATLLFVDLDSIGGNPVLLYFVSIFTAIFVGMWFSRDAGRYVVSYRITIWHDRPSEPSIPYNGNLSVEDRGRFINYYGACASLAIALLGPSLILLTSGYLAFGIILLAIVILLFFVPLRHSNGDEFSKTTPLLFAPFGIKALAVTCVFFMAVTPFAVVEFPNLAMDIEIGEESFHVHAHMFDHVFEYDKVEDFTYRPSFTAEKTPTSFGLNGIVCGNAYNKEIGWYDFALHEDVKPTITFSYEGKSYAFNDASPDLTKETFEKIKAKL